MSLLKVKEENVGKANKSYDKELLDNELEHVLCNLFYPKSDKRSSKMQKIFLQLNIIEWDNFISTSRKGIKTFGFQICFKDA